MDLQREITRPIKELLPEIFTLHLFEPRRENSDAETSFTFTSIGCVNRDCTMMVFLSFDNLLDIVEVGSSAPILSIHCPGFVYGAEFSPNGEMVAAMVSGTNNLSALHIWKLDGQLLQTIGGDSKLRWIRFSEDSNWIATTSDGCICQLWDVCSGRLLHSFVGHQETITSASFNQDSTKLVTASSDLTMRVWDCSSANCLAIIHNSNAAYAKFSASGNHIITVYQRRISSHTGMIINEWNISALKRIAAIKLSHYSLDQMLLMVLIYACSRPGHILSLQLIAEHNPQVSFEAIRQIWLGMDQEIRSVLQIMYQVVIGKKLRKRKRVHRV